MSAHPKIIEARDREVKVMIESGVKPETARHIADRAAERVQRDRDGDRRPMSPPAYRQTGA